MQRLVNVYRGDHVESFHSGSIAVVEAGGRLLASAGDATLETFLRSAAKPFQTIPLLQAGGASYFDLTSEQIALSCGSHGGEPFHVSTAAAILRKGDFDESDLLCGVHHPYDEKALAELRISGESASVLHNNCSGKHAGMLLACQLMDVQTSDYVAAAHPLQLDVRRIISEFADLDAATIPMGIDGCGVPSFLMSLYRAALAYARLVETSDAPGSASALPDYTDSARLITESMTGCAEYVGGRWTMTSPLMQAFNGELLAKEGAEGFYTMVFRGELADRVREHLHAEDAGSIAVALKVHDGSMGRGRNPAILRTLELLGVDRARLSSLESYRESTVRNVSGTLVGEVRAEFELDIL
ncbi:MAG TPA: asparaginase [Thermoanaerobaculia bacterium]|nr:asparaginase [Thermoanaerobaculia bacterium]